MGRSAKAFLGFVLALGFLVTPAKSEEREVWKVAVYRLPGWVKNEREGRSIRFLKILAKEAGVTVDISVVHRKRLLKRLGQGHVDMIFAYIEPEGLKVPDDWPFRYSSFDLFEVGFFAFINKEFDLKNINKDNTATVMGYETLFGVELQGFKCLACALRMVERGRLDAFLLSDVVGEPIIAKEGIEGLRKKFYKHIYVKLLFRKNMPKEFERHVQEAFAKTVRTGDYKKIYGGMATKRIIEQYKKR